RGLCAQCEERKAKPIPLGFPVTLHIAMTLKSGDDPVRRGHVQPEHLGNIRNARADATDLSQMVENGHGAIEQLCACGLLIRGVPGHRAFGPFRPSKLSYMAVG